VRVYIELWNPWIPVAQEHLVLIPRIPGSDGSGRQDPDPSDSILNIRCANEWMHSRCSREPLALGAKAACNKIFPELFYPDVLFLDTIDIYLFFEII
jgi:hypothetical protein